MAVGAPTPETQQLITDTYERSVLIAELKRMSKLALEGENERRSSDRKGNKLAKSRFWEEGILQGRMPITANQAVAIWDRFSQSVTQGSPIPFIEPITSGDDDGALLLEGGLQTNWINTRMDELVKASMRLAGFTRPVLWYTYWDPQLRNGVGDFTTRLIPGHMSIIDNRKMFVKDMEFVGIREVATRAKLIMLFPDKAAEIEAASIYAGANSPGMQDDPLRTHFGGGKSDSVSRLVANDQNQFVGKTTVKIGGTKGVNPLSQEVEVEYLWIDDPTPTKKRRPKLDARGTPKYRVSRHPDTNELLYKVTGHNVVQTPFGAVYQPQIEPQMEPVFEDVIVKKYPHRRHIAWIPQDGIILWDVRWDGPLPVYTHRVNAPINEYWLEGTALRLASLAVARNILYTIIFQRLKLSLSGTWLATPQSGLKRNKLTPEDGQVFYAKRIDDQSIRQFPVQPLDPSHFQLLTFIEEEMEALIGITPVMKGEADGRADSAETYDKLMESGGVALLDAAQFLQNTISDWATVACWYMQNYYTHEHYVMLEDADGDTSWRAASALACKGEYAIHIDTKPMMAYNESARFARAMQYYQMGVYTLPMVCKFAHIPQWRRALRERSQLLQDPSKAWLLGGQPSAFLPPSATRPNHHSKAENAAKAQQAA